MKKTPVPQLIYANDCARLPAQDMSLLEAYAPFGTDILCMTRGLADLGYERREWGEMGHPLHETTREGALPTTSELRSKSLSVMFRNWHPGPLLFEVTADALAWRYSEALMLAIERIRHEPDPPARWPRKPSQMKPAGLPDPMLCPPEWCNAKSPPVCIDFEEPVFGEPGVELMPSSGTGWVMDPGQPLRQRAIPAEERDLPQCVHPNRCSGWRVPAGTEAGTLSFRIPALQVGMVAVCCGSKGCGRKFLEAGAQFLIDGTPPESPVAQHWADKCVQVQARFREPASDEAGRSVQLDILLPPMSESLPPVTHVFGL